MMRRRLWGIGVTVGASVLAVVACDPSTWNPSEASEDTLSERTACIDPATGELIQPGPDVDCRVPSPPKPKADPVVRDLEGGGKAVDLEGKLDKNQVEPAPQNRLAVIDPRTGELLGPRPSEANAAARYDRIMTRATVLMKRQAAPTVTSLEEDDLHAEPLDGGGVMIDLKGRFHMPLMATVSKDGRIRLGHDRHPH